MKALFLLLALTTFSLSAEEKYIIMEGTHEWYTYIDQGNFQKAVRHTKQIISFPFKVEMKEYSKELLIQYFVESAKITRNEEIEFLVFDDLASLQKAKDYRSHKYKHRISSSKFRRFEKAYLKRIGK